MYVPITVHSTVNVDLTLHVEYGIVSQYSTEFSGYIVVIVMYV